MKASSTYMAILACGIGMMICASPVNAVTLGPNPIVGAYGLADGRAYELVSPVDKNGYSILSGLQSVTEASSNGHEVNYESVGAFAGALANPLVNPYSASRNLSKWLTVALDAATPLPPTRFGLGSPEYTAPSHLTQPIYNSTEPLTANAPPGVPNLFLRELNGSYSLITAGTPPASQLGNYILSFLGASSKDLSHVLFSANADLTPDAPTAPAEAQAPILYEWVNDTLRLVGILPDNSIASTSTNAAANGNSISSDGSRIFFATSGQLYVRTSGTTTIHISASQRVPPDPHGEQMAEFEGATPDGSIVLFSSAEELTNASNTGGNDNSSDLYAYNVNDGHLTDLTVDANPADAMTGPSVQGVLGMSDDGSYVYFTADGQLIAGQGAQGQPNLYVWHGGEVKFIATLSPSDRSNWFPYSSRAGTTAYVTPNGKGLGFISHNSLTGYNNTDARTAARDSEVFRYSAESDTLVCASCDPGGGAPIGNATLAKLGLTGYSPRNVTDDGKRIFFNSSDPLVPGSANGHIKVFEYENGDVYLISSGTSNADDFFGDASASGDDVFFTTVGQLAPQDGDTLVDLYDAHVGGARQSPITVPNSCSGDTCQGVVSTLPSSSAPSSEVFFGLGNIDSSSTTGKPAVRVKTKTHLKKRPRRRGKVGHRVGAGRRHHPAKGRV